MSNTIKKKTKKSLTRLSLDLKQANEFYKMGVAHHRKSILAEAVSCYNSAIKLNPKHDMALYCLGLAMQERDCLDEAMNCYERSLKLNPSNAMAHNNLGFILEKRERPEEAVSCYKKALQINPQFDIALNNLGNALSACDRIDDAIIQHEKALKINPNYAHAFNSLGNVLHKKGRLDEAINHYRKAIQINPHLIDAHWNLSHVLLKSGNFLRGWKEYEWRWQLKEYGQRNYPQPLWDGTSLNGKKIFVYTEQGVGDVVMFASCLPEIIEQAAECTIECDARLIPIFARSFPKAHFIEMLQEGDAFPSNLLSYDVKVPIGSLPKYLLQDLRSFPQRYSYLKPDLQEVEKWHWRFKELGEGLKIGISWQGGKHLSVKRERSVPLEKWHRLFDLKELHFINLQYGDCAAELQELQRQKGITIYDWDDSDPLLNLDDFAAQIAALDLVISVDNSTAHIAGALGVPVWTLLPFNCDWRWMQDFTDTLWYKSMRLFCQKIYGDWDGVIDNLLPIINDLVSSKYIPEMVDEKSYRKLNESGSVSTQSEIKTLQDLNKSTFSRTKIAVLLTTFLRDQLLFKTVQTIVKYWQDSFYVLIGDQGCKSDSDFKAKEEQLHALFTDKMLFQYIRLPFDCGLSAARNYLVQAADNIRAPYCFLMADSIQFIEKYDLNPIISFLEQDITRGIAGFYLYGGNRTSWQRDLDLVEGEYFYLKIPRRTPIEHQGIIFQPVDICDNFFLAKTECLIRNTWDENLKLSEHEDFFWRLKNSYEPYKVFWTYDIQAQYTHEKRHDYLKMRNRIYEEFRGLLQKKYNLKSWIQYEE